MPHNGTAKGGNALSAPQPQPEEASATVRQEPTDKQTIIFMVVLSVICAVILAILASALAEPKEIAKDLDRSKQMMIAAKILTHEGYFLLEDKGGKYVPAKYSKDGILVPGTPHDLATKDQLLDVYQKRLKPMLLAPDGKLVTFKDAGIDFDKYVVDFKKVGYYTQKYKLIYQILPNPSEANSSSPIGYVIPVNGMGLWDAIYGYLAIKTDGNTVIGTSWYDQKETPGLGALIAEESWQALFPGKQIFQPNPDGTTDFPKANLGITVVKGKVAEVYGDNPKAKTAVDGMTGATLTGNGVTEGFKKVLTAYRPFLLALAEKKADKKETNKATMPK